MPNKQQITVTIKTVFLAEQSDIDNDEYVFAYFVTIKNTGTQSAQLISRHWIMTEADNETHEVEGLGVVGKQPWIKPNESYQYKSHTVFKMPTGSMHGTYHMMGEDGTQFDADIPLFECKMPRVLH